MKKSLFFFGKQSHVSGLKSYSVFSVKKELVQTKIHGEKLGKPIISLKIPTDHTLGNQYGTPKWRFGI